MSSILRAVVVSFALGCATTGPAETFDQYWEAYGAGDADTLWELSSPSARADARRVQQEILNGLESPDLEQRTFWEGQFGTTPEEIRALSERGFFVWAIGTIRKRLGSGAIRSVVSRIARVKEESLGADGVVIVYRTGEEISRLPFIRTPEGWRVDQSPFPPAQTAPPP